MRVRSHGAWAALGFLCIGSAGAAASCSWNPFDPPTYDEAKQISTGTHGGVGGGGTGGSGGTGGGALCGNNEVEASEGCDDGNQSDGDGCSSTCQPEECLDCSGGACGPLAASTSCNSGAQVCDGKGGCVNCVPAETACDKCKNCGGYDCNEADDCASTACVTGVCRSADGSPCADPVECASNHCSNGLCAKCSVGAQCTSGSCDLAQCQAAMGEPCDSLVQCAPGLMCSATSICKGGAGATCVGNHQCLSNRCLNGNCITCVSNMECAPGLCSNGACSAVTIPNDAYCVNSEDCLYNKCAGFPRKCESP